MGFQQMEVLAPLRNPKIFPKTGNHTQTSPELVPFFDFLLFLDPLGFPPAQQKLSSFCCWGPDSSQANGVSPTWAQFPIWSPKSWGSKALFPAHIRGFWLQRCSKWSAQWPKARPRGAVVNCWWLEGAGRIPDLAFKRELRSYQEFWKDMVLKLRRCDHDLIWLYSSPQPYCNSSCGSLNHRQTKQTRFVFKNHPPFWFSTMFPRNYQPTFRQLERTG